MLRPGEHADKAPEQQSETALRGLGRKLGDRWLVADDELQLRNQVDHKPPVRAQSFQSASRHAPVRLRSCREAAGSGAERLAPGSNKGMSRLYWSNLPEAKSPRGGTSALCSSLTTEDLPMPEYPQTSTSSAAPSRRPDRRRRARSRSRARARRAFRGSVAGRACLARPAGNRRCGAELPCSKAAPRSLSRPAAVW